MKRFRVWLTSGANAQAKFEDTVTTEDLGFTDDEWEETTEETREKALKEAAFSYAEWGFYGISD